MVNTEFEPNDDEEAILNVLKHDRETVNPMYIREHTDLDKGSINTALTRLTSAGWVRKVTRGLYEFVDDPREEQERHLAEPGDVSEDETPLEEPTTEQQSDGPDEDAEEILRSLELPGSGSRYEARVDAVLSFYDHLQERPGELVSKGDFGDLVDEEDIDVGYSSFDSLWSNWVKKNEDQGRPYNALTQLPGVEMDGDDYVYTG